MIKDLLSPLLFPNVTTVRFEYVPFTWPKPADVHWVHPLVRLYVVHHCMRKTNSFLPQPAHLRFHCNVFGSAFIHDVSPSKAGGGGDVQRCLDATLDAVKEAAFRSAPSKLFTRRFPTQVSDRLTSHVQRIFSGIGWRIRASGCCRLSCDATTSGSW